MASGLDPAGGTRGKFHYPLRSLSAALTPVPLVRVYLLTDADSPIRLEVLNGLDAVATLVQEIYFVQYAAALGAGERCFRQAAALARSVRVVRLMRPRAIDRVPELAAMIEADLGQG